MKFCCHCGERVVWRQPAGDNRERFICEHCDTIHYQNPNIVAGCLPTWQDKVLLCRRGIEPRYGLWTLPAGFMENHETTIEAAQRETYEEATTRVRVLDLFTNLSLPHISQVYMMYRAELIDGRFSPGAESLETRLFAEHEIPWEELAFPVIRVTLELFFADRRAGRYRVHSGDMQRQANTSFTFNHFNSDC